MSTWEFISNNRVSFIPVGIVDFHFWRTSFSLTDDSHSFTLSRLLVLEFWILNSLLDIIKSHHFWFSMMKLLPDSWKTINIKTFEINILLFLNMNWLEGLTLLPILCFIHFLRIWFINRSMHKTSFIGLLVDNHCIFKIVSRIRQNCNNCISTWGILFKVIFHMRFSL